MKATAGRRAGQSISSHPHPRASGDSGRRPYRHCDCSRWLPVDGKRCPTPKGPCRLRMLHLRFDTRRLLPPTQSFLEKSSLEFSVLEKSRIFSKRRGMWAPTPRFIEKLQKTLQLEEP